MRQALAARYGSCSVPFKVHNGKGKSSSSPDNARRIRLADRRGAFRCHLADHDRVDLMSAGAPIVDEATTKIPFRGLMISRPSGTLDKTPKPRTFTGPIRKGGSRGRSLSASAASAVRRAAGCRLARHRRASGPRGQVGQPSSFLEPSRRQGDDCAPGSIQEHVAKGDQRRPRFARTDQARPGGEGRVPALASLPVHRKEFRPMPGVRHRSRAAAQARGRRQPVEHAVADDGGGEAEGSNGVGIPHGPKESPA